MDISAAVDFSTANASLAVGELNTDKVIFCVNRPMSGREASYLLPWIIEQLQANGFSLENVKNWTCGIGPGSFTGLRIIASIVAGLTYGQPNIKVRGVPSGTAIAEYAAEPGIKTAVLYDGRRNELICFSQKNEPMTIINSDNVNQLNVYDEICAMQSEKTAIEKILPPDLKAQVKYVSEFPIENLLLNTTTPWQDNSTGDQFFEPDLVYIRPAV